MSGLRWKHCWCVCVFLQASFYSPREVLASRRVPVHVPTSGQPLAQPVCLSALPQVCQALQKPQMWKWFDLTCLLVFLTSLFGILQFLCFRESFLLIWPTNRFLQKGPPGRLICCTKKQESPWLFFPLYVPLVWICLSWGSLKNRWMQGCFNGEA